jgi:peptide/nickel transport system substrate-binding protein
MIRSPLRLLAALALVALTLFAVACGGDDEGGSSDSASKDSGTPAEGKKGGKLEQLGASDVDFLDPGQTYYSAGYQVLYATNTTLYGPKPGEEDAVPALAEGAPEISDDSKSVTVTLKKGYKFGPPVNREIQAKDVKYGIERAFSKHVPNQYTTYFNFIEGAPDKPGEIKDVSGIQISPDDPYKITFKLSKPQAAGFAASLVMAYTAPVPKEFAAKFDKETPSTYNENVISSGPYMVENDSKGKAIGYKPGKSIQLVRNPNWDANKGDYRPAYLDEILLRTNATDANVSGRQVLQGQNLVLDTNPPAQILKRVVQRQKDQLQQLQGGIIRWFPLNISVKPLDDLNVRKAILAAFDRDAARKARGGEFVGELGTHFIPPGMSGFDEGGGAKGPGFDFLANPKGDMAVAEKYMKAAGYSSGKYDGTEELLMVGANVDPGKATAEVAKAQMEKLGFKIRLRTVPQDAVYTEWCQQPAKKVAVCGGASWGKDYNDAQTMLEPLFKGSNFFKEGGNNNLAQLQDPKIDKAMDEAALLAGDERAQAWGEIDKMITEQAPAVPFLWDKTNLIHAENVNGVGNAYSSSWDLSFTSIK